MIILGENDVRWFDIAGIELLAIGSDDGVSNTQEDLATLFDRTPLTGVIINSFTEGWAVNELHDVVGMFFFQTSVIDGDKARFIRDTHRFSETSIQFVLIQFVNQHLDDSVTFQYAVESFVDHCRITLTQLPFDLVPWC